MRVLMVGDVVGEPGRRAVAEILPELRASLAIDYVVLNAENAAAGRGLTEKTAHQLFDAGVDVITSGNHIFNVKEFVPTLDGDLPILRPANYPPRAPGRGMISLDGLTVINLMGRVFMPTTVDDPFPAVDLLLDQAPADAIVVIDFHAEATSEQQAMGWYVNGRVAAVSGTHTHVPTADARVLPGGTALTTDLGMVGVLDSVIGYDIDSVLERFLTAMPTRLPVADGAEAIFGSVLIDIDDGTRLATSVERVDRRCFLQRGPHL